MFKVMLVLYEREGADRTEALRYWAEQHGPIAAKIPGLREYVQNHAVGAPDGNPPFLGIAELYFDDEAAFGVGAGSEEFAAAIADLVNFADETKLPTAFVEPVTIAG